ncbi:SpaA isopeptide-forming pilin-related protein [Carnobacterium gallinarum]|uniref:SpaA isopeptide-forming pilin-related protein n=1 Tax=Carnobacterium gallinarum TaxID=2749 RepID=UPI00055005E8|nr:SpaA isopeptide-forming pilin-related protein [Carnobacterium gallinarum]
MNKTHLKVTTLIGLLTIIVAFFIAPITSFAATVNYDKIADYVSTWHVKSLGGLHWTDDGIYMIKADNQPAFCIDHGTLLNGGSGFNPSELTIPEKEALSLIAYYGYQMNPTTENYGITQNIIWETLGDELLTTNLPDYDSRKTEIMNQVTSHQTKPSFNDNSITLNVGESITLTDNNNVLEKYTNQVANTANLTVDKNGNTLKLTATDASKETGTLQYSIAKDDSVGQSFVYAKPGEQNIATFKLADAGSFNLDIKVNLNGNIQAKKVDADTGKPLANAKLKFEYSGLTKVYDTGKDGLATITDIKAGTEVKITEITAPNGYVNAGELKTVIVKPNQTIEVVLNNQAQLGTAHLSKTGQVPIDATKTGSDFGDLYSFVYDYKPLADVTYDIKATENILTPDGTVRVKKGETAATVTTNENGEWLSPNLFLGKYEAIETKAPNGYILNSTPIPFELTYAGQDIPLTSTSLPTATNDFQKIKLQVFKNQESLIDWKDNQPVLETIKGNNKIFGLFIRDEYKLSETVKIPKDSLLGLSTVKDGIASFDLKIPNGKYYLKELDSGIIHEPSDKEYDFEFKAMDNSEIFPIDVYQNIIAQGKQTLTKIVKTPILNKLHLNKFTIKKLNETATLKEKDGYQFAFDGSGKEATFTLEDENKTVIQTVKIDEHSLGTFENIPVGTYYLKEKATSSDDFILNTETIRIESTLEDIKAYDEKDKLLGESSATNKEPTILFELNNQLKKGTAELTKKDISTGELLPNTGIQILDKDKKIIVEGKTNHSGIFTFKQLPKGTYYFQEYQAPQGYELNETPIQFEIKEDGQIVKSEMTNQKVAVPKEVASFPQTGESKTTLLSILGMLLIGLVLAVTFYYRKKKS